MLTLADMRTNLARKTENSLRENYGRHIRIFKTVIPMAITAAESSAAVQSIYKYDKKGTVAKAYEEFMRCVIQCGEKQRNKHESHYSFWFTNQSPAEKAVMEISIMAKLTAMELV